MEPSVNLRAQLQAGHEAAEITELQRQALAERLQGLEQRPEGAPRLGLPRIPLLRPTRRQIGALLPGLPVGLAPPLGLLQVLQLRSAPPADAATQLELEAGEPIWLEVRQLNGKSVFVGELLSRRRFALGEGLQVLAGRPDLVRVQVDDVPDRVLGSVEQVEWQTFKPSAR